MLIKKKETQTQSKKVIANIDVPKRRHKISMMLVFPKKTGIGCDRFLSKYLMFMLKRRTNILLWIVFVELTIILIKLWK